VQGKKPKVDTHLAIARSIPNFDEDKYNTWWAILASMPGLRKLSVDLKLFLYPPITDEVCSTVLAPIDHMRSKDLLEFHIAAPEPTFRLFRRHQNPPYTSISFFSVPASARDYEWDDGPYSRPRDQGTYFPIPDFDSV